MSSWECGVEGCGGRYEDVESLVVHQTNEHEPHSCKVCGTVVPEGYFAIRHAFDEHTRAEYVRAYDADSSAVRERESVKSDVEAAVDLDAVADRLDVELDLD
jgi:hypothetical protein